jgi:NCS1 family nucleobase:cation symporter-1
LRIHRIGPRLLYRLLRHLRELHPVCLHLLTILPATCNTNYHSAGNDIASLLPRYITIKRGFFICAILSYAICPWYLLSSASVFINFLSSYQIFLSAITGILICDYYLLRRGALSIPDLYTAHPEGMYHYFHGFGLRAFATYLIAIAPNFYGFLNQMGVDASVGVQRFYFVAYPVGLVVAFLGYYGFALWRVPKGMVRGAGWREPREYLDEFDSARYSSGDIEGVEVQAVGVVGKSEK